MIDEMKTRLSRYLGPLAQAVSPVVPGAADFARRCRMRLLKESDLLEWRRIQAREMGVTLGNNVLLFSLNFFSEPQLITIGDNTVISGDVFFVTHDGGCFVDPARQPGMIGCFGRITVGSNCFIGIRATILQDVQIGDRCIVAAGAVVTESFPDDSVIVGNPAQRIMSSSTFHMLRRRSPLTFYHPDWQWPKQVMDRPPSWVLDAVKQQPMRAPRRPKPPARAPGAPPPAAAPETPSWHGSDNGQ